MDAGPVERWGLDPRFWSFNRFFAGQLLALPAAQLPGVYAAPCSTVDATTVAPSSAPPAAAPESSRADVVSFGGSDWPESDWRRRRRRAPYGCDGLVAAIADREL